MAEVVAKRYGQLPVAGHLVPLVHLVVDVVLPIGHLDSCLQFALAQHGHIVELPCGNARMAARF